jgi:chromosome segregation ATPase
MICKDQLEQRLAELTSELEKGRRQLAALDSQREETQQALLRISGAIQVIQELLAGEPDLETMARPERVAAVESRTGTSE